ncbi:MAG: hypothetical protein H6738_01860 [Alphaproteobacteria bacterium]|nr:hypothetical protein [Alphaproteobacteria bacterium]MCB9695514.1 hypothetical protein [Alphaproteobacteria bacterium]
MRYGIVLAAIACGGTTSTWDDVTPTGTTGDTGTPEPVTIQLSQGDGMACLFGEGGSAGPYGGYDGDTTFVDGGTTEILVVLEDCASGCASDMTATCSATLVGSEVQVTASGSYQVPGGNPTCPSMCTVVAATCPGPTLATGSWSVVYADPPATFAVPSTGTVPCSGR